MKLKVAEHFDLERLKEYGFIYDKGKYKLVSDKNLLPSEERWVKRKIAMTVFGKTREIQVSKNIVCEYDNKIYILCLMVQDGVVEIYE